MILYMKHASNKFGCIYFDKDDKYVVEINELDDYKVRTSQWFNIETFEEAFETFNKEILNYYDEDA